MRFALGSKDIKNVSYFIEIVRHIRNISMDVVFRFDSEGLYVQAMDQSHISLLDLRLNAGWFDEYKIEHPEAVGVNTKMLYKVLSCRSKDQVFVWETEGDSVSIRFPKSATSVQKDFNIPMIDIDTDLLNVTDFEAEADFEMDSKLFESLMTDLSTYGDEIYYECSEEGIKISAKGETGTMDTTIPMDDLNSYSINEGLTMRVRYASTLLQTASQFSKLSGVVTIGVSRENPLQMTAHLGADGVGTLRYFIAPKAEVEE